MGVTKLSDQRQPLWERCKGLCEISGRPLDYDTFDMHHRRNRGMGGTSRDDVHELWNLLALDPVVHNNHPQAVHRVRRWSEERGYLVPKHVDETQLILWPVLLGGWLPPSRQRWVLLGDKDYWVPPHRYMQRARDAGLVT